MMVKLFEEGKKPTNIKKSKTDKTVRSTYKSHIKRKKKIKEKDFIIDNTFSNKKSVVKENRVITSKFNL